MPPRVTILGINYAPEHSGDAPYVASLARGLVERGFAVRVITTFPHYPEWRIRPGYGGWTRRETIDGVDVVRVRHYIPRSPRWGRRLLSELTFGARLLLARWGAPDVVVAVVPALFATSVVRPRLRRTPHVVWVQDVYTRGVVEIARKGQLVERGMRRVESGALRRADAVVVIHERPAASVTGELGVDPGRVRVLRNWALGDETPGTVSPDAAAHRSATRRELGWRDDETIVVHAGNLGVKQDLGVVVDAARLAEERGAPVRFVLIGEGVGRTELQERAHGIRTIEVLPPLPEPEFRAALAAADALLLNERPGLADSVLPSKLTAYFDAGRPVIAAVGEASASADELRRAGAGVLVEPGDPAALVDAVLAVRGDPDEAARLGANGRRYRVGELGEQHAVDAYAELLTELARTPARRSRRRS